MRTTINLYYVNFQQKFPDKKPGYFITCINFTDSVKAEVVLLQGGAARPHGGGRGGQPLVVPLQLGLAGEVWPLRPRPLHTAALPS